MGPVGYAVLGVALLAFIALVVATMRRSAPETGHCEWCGQVDFRKNLVGAYRPAKEGEWRSHWLPGCKFHDEYQMAAGAPVYVFGHSACHERHGASGISQR